MSLTERSTEQRVDAAPQSNVVQSSKAPAPCLPASGRSEEAHNYHSILFNLGPNWRVIECRGQIQWILQRLSGGRRGRPRWTSRSYCLTRDGLSRVMSEAVGSLDAASRAFLASLPMRHPGPLYAN